MRNSPLKSDFLGFHIHVDAQALSQDFERRLVSDYGFWRSDFSGHPEGIEHYEPPHHLTQKMVAGKEFRKMFDDIVSHVKGRDAIKGYLEGEYIALDKDLAVRPFDPSVSVPFKLELAFLPPGTFRESEVHVTMDRDRSHPQLLSNLIEMGLFAAYLPKPYGTAVIFTAQGSRAKIDAVVPAVMDYVERAGGAVECSVKEERIVNWWMSESNLPLPPVVDCILWLR
jgi:hypothetical protein